MTYKNYQLTSAVTVKYIIVYVTNIHYEPANGMLIRIIFNCHRSDKFTWSSRVIHMHLTLHQFLYSEKV
jgi:hypothetical protein